MRSVARTYGRSRPEWHAVSVAAAAGEANRKTEPGTRRSPGAEPENRSCLSARHYAAAILGDADRTWRGIPSGFLLLGNAKQTRTVREPGSYDSVAFYGAHELSYIENDHRLYEGHQQSVPGRQAKSKRVCKCRESHHRDLSDCWQAKI
jgi:hypothetical protein